MPPRSYRLQAFIIKRRNYGEADKIVTVFSKEMGKRTLIAKGIRKITSRRAGCLELFNHATMMVARGRGDMDVVCETYLNRMYQGLGYHYLKTQVAYQLVELVDALTRDEQTHEDLFELLERAFDFLAETELDYLKADRVIVRFKSRILELLGFGLPRTQNLEELREYIENIVERQLVARRSFEV